MANRVFFFSNPEIIAYIQKHYIPVVGDDWYQRRRKDTEGEFYTRLHKQAPHATPDGWSRQGLYTLTANGKLLSFTNTWDMKPFLEYLHGGIAAWNALPEHERKAEPIPTIEDRDRDASYVREPPENGAIIKVHTRILETGEDGHLQKVRAEGQAAWGTHAATDHLWLTKAEIDTLLPAGRETFPLPQPIVTRIIRHNLTDNTRGEPTRWENGDIKEATFTCTAIDPQTVRIEGKVKLHTPDNKRGYEAVILGHYKINTAGKLSEFKLLAHGDHWGDGKYTPHARKGRTPLGIAFHLIPGDKPADRIPPQGIRKPERYW